MIDMAIKSKPILHQQHGQFGSLVRKVQTLEQYSHIVHTQLSSRLRQHCWVANYEHQTLTLAVDNANWATLLRFELPSLLKALQEHPGFRGLQEIKYFIYQASSQMPAAPAPTKSIHSLSRTSQQLLSELADEITHPALKLALKRLSDFR
ncbi:MAG: hypothetical protein Tsb005_00010 [Gammaproteobacteria bacterium]